MKRRKRSRNGYDKHHRKCRSHGGSNHPSNISMVRANQHRAYHVLFQNMTPVEVADLLTEIWIDPAYEMVAKRRPPPIKKYIPYLYE